MTESRNNVEFYFAPLLKLNAPAALRVPLLTDDKSTTQSALTEDQNFATETGEVSDVAVTKPKLEIDSSFSLKDTSQTEIITQTCIQNQRNCVTTSSHYVKHLPLHQAFVTEYPPLADINDTLLKMGNQQSEKKESDNDTPDEQNAACCKPPKRKSKDKSGKRKSSRSDDTEFDSKEVYPFDTKCKEESEVVEPIDLEPFEIVETDDLSFIAGAGTSGVILSGSDGKFRISREIILEEKDEPSEVTLELNDSFKETTDADKITSPKPKGDDRQSSASPETIPSCNITSGAVSDIESNFPVNSLESNVISNSTNQDKHVDPTKMKKQNDLASVCTSDTEITNSKLIVLSQEMFTKRAESNEQDIKPIEDKSNEVNGGETMPLNAEHLSGTEREYENKIDALPPTKCNVEMEKQETNSSAVYENVNVTDVEKIIAKQAPIQTVVPVKYILTQEMFKKEPLIDKESSENDSQKLCTSSDPMTTFKSIDYDILPTKSNIDSSMSSKRSIEEKLPIDISETVPKKNNCSINISNPTYGYDEDDSIISGTQEENIYETVENDVKRDPEKETLQNRNCNAPEGIQTETDLTVDSFELNKGEPNPVPPDINRAEASISDNAVKTDGEHVSSAFSEPDNHPAFAEKNALNDHIPTITEDLYATIGDPVRPSENNNKNRIGPDAHMPEDEKTIISKTDSLEVPSRDDTASSSREDTVPPPSPASMDVLAEENEDDEEEEASGNKSNDMIDFGDVVCKRLSQLLEDKSFHEDDTATTNVDQDSIIYFSPREFIGTSTGRYETQDMENYAEENASVPENDDILPSVYESKNDTTDKRTPRDVANSCCPEISFSKNLQTAEVGRLEIKRNESAETLKRASGDSTKYNVSQSNGSSDDDLPEFFDPDNLHDRSNKDPVPQTEDSKRSLSLQEFDDTLVQTTPNSSFVDDLTDVTPTAELSREFTALPELAKTEDKSVVQYEQTDQTTGRRSITGTESDLDMSEQRTDMSTDSMYADDEAEETMDILFTKTYTEPIEGAEVFLSCTVVNSAYKDESKKREVWLSSDEALEYFEANASEVMSTAFMKAKKEMKDIQLCLQNLRKQMDNFHGNFDDISLPDLPGAVSDSLSPGYHDARRKAVTD